MGARTKSTSLRVHAVVARHLRSRTPRLAGLAAAVGLLAVSSALASQPTASPALAGSSRGSRAHQALLELYALDSRLQAAQARVAYLGTEAAKLRSERRALHSELRAAGAMLAAARRSLAFQLRTLYEQGEVDPLAVVFGATSLGNGIRELDNLKRSAAESRRVVAQARMAERRLLHARRTLASSPAVFSTAVDADPRLF